MAEEKLTKVQEGIVNMIKDNLDKGYLWKKGWRSEKQMSIKGTVYKGINAFWLSLTAMCRGYEDNRWMTFNAMKTAGYTFKKDENHKCLANGQGVPIEYFETYDRKTKKMFVRSTLEGMTTEEAQEYMKENVYTVRKYYTVFNCSLIDGVPAKSEGRRFINDNERINDFLSGWSETESKITYGGDRACYVPLTDEIHMPSRANFINDNEFYGTALHEVAHSTGAEKRLNRDMKGSYGSKEYAQEELVAEISSLFISQEFGTEITEGQVRNSTAYIENWQSAIKDDVNSLVKAVADAMKVSKYIADKESKMKKEQQGGEIAA